MTIGNHNECQCISGFKQEKIYKDFQLKITSNERANLVENIVRSILPSYNLNNLNNNLNNKRRLTILTLLQFAHKIEQGMFYSSNSRKEYLYLISKKIDYIRREFEERRLLRKIDRLKDNSKISNWKKDLNDEKRQTIIKKLIQVLMPKVIQFDVRFLNFIKYVKRIERLCFLKANSKANYYNLLSERVQKIQMELNNKRAERSLEAKELTNELIINKTDQLNEINDQANQLPKTDDKLLAKFTLNPIRKSF